MATDAPGAGRIRRFGAAERALHWTTAAAVLVLLATGALMSVPALVEVTPRSTAKTWHLLAALALMATFGLLVEAGGAPVRRTLRQLQYLDRDDVRWLRQAPWRLLSSAPAPEQGRFNAGQKLNACVVAGLLVVSYVTGALLWLGERDHALRFDGTVLVHDGLTYVLVVLIVGHIVMAAVLPGTRPSLAGMIRGSVDREWARRHHARWERQNPPDPPSR